MKQTTKRLFALLLALSMCLSLAAPAWAAETDPADEFTAESSTVAEEAPAEEQPDVIILLQQLSLAKVF